MLLVFSGIKLQVEGLGKLDMNDHYVFIVNHSSAYDIPILVIAVPLFTSFIAKKELFSIPFFGLGLRAIGHIPMDRSSARKARGSIKKAIEQLHEKYRSMILFPEGTRSLTGQVGEFKRGAFSLAKEAAIKMVPILIHGADKVANKNSWHITPGRVKVIISDPVDEKTVAQASKEELMLMAHNRVKAMQKNQLQ